MAPPEPIKVTLPFSANNVVADLDGDGAPDNHLGSSGGAWRWALRWPA
jgi:hypothetical protein